ncbi:hypothetical protein PVAND_014314 [Polypedilum vanderplanki]|uniref:Large ribosomal subunit protein mL38 n=1 Tax=Polypedilum vanderplanki TaxID=319348 RepID=A0A9J6CSQ6_POLVA|nr:hypothetical protein PVAND_014314 [Polypedilum vanderplanki]
MNHQNWLPGSVFCLTDNPKIEDEELVVRRFDIGFPYERTPRSLEFRTRYEHLKKQKKDFNFEKKARSNELEIDLEDVKNEWLKSAGPLQLRKKIAEHNRIYYNLFGKFAYFVPREKPEEDTMWTLILTYPDGHLTKENSEYVHWMITNIFKNDLAKGEQIVPYLQPIPFKGTGYHRYIFILYKQDKKLDLSEFKLKNEKNLGDRTFYTFDFCKKYQDFIIPTGLSFFQTKWDESIGELLYNQFDVKQPIFEYDFPRAFLKYQKWFPKKQAFNLYLDRYADPKEVNKKYLEQRLAKTHPFEGPEPKLLYQNAQPLKKEIPSWYRTEMRKE